MRLINAMLAKQSIVCSFVNFAIVVHGYSSYEMLYGVMTPIPKVSGTTDSSNFWAITLCTTVSKLMNVIVFNKYKKCIVHFRPSV